MTRPRRAGSRACDRVKRRVRVDETTPRISIAFFVSRREERRRERRRRVAPTGIIRRYSSPERNRNEHRRRSPSVSSLHVPTPFKTLTPPGSSPRPRDGTASAGCTSFRSCGNAAYMPAAPRVHEEHPSTRPISRRLLHLPEHRRHRFSTVRRVQHDARGGGHLRRDPHLLVGGHGVAETLRLDEIGRRRRRDRPRPRPRPCRAVCRARTRGGILECRRRRTRGRERMRALDKARIPTLTLRRFVDAARTQDAPYRHAPAKKPSPSPSPSRPGAARRVRPSFERIPTCQARRFRRLGRRTVFYPRARVVAASPSPSAGPPILA